MDLRAFDKRFASLPDRLPAARVRKPGSSMTAAGMGLAIRRPIRTCNCWVNENGAPAVGMSIPGRSAQGREHDRGTRFRRGL